MPSPTLTIEQLEIIKAIAHEIIKGDPDVAAEKEAAKQRKASMRAKMIEDIERQKATKVAAQDACNHRKDNGQDSKFSTGGQVFNDGTAGIICGRCGRIWKVPLTEDQRRLIDSGDYSLAGITPPDRKFVYLH